MRGKEHDDSVKAAVIASLLAGQGVNETARAYGLSSSVVSRYKATIPEQMEQVGARKTRDFGEMIGNYLEELLTTAIAQQIHFRDPDWLKQQPASELAVLHGVSIDKGTKLFEAAANAHSSN